NLFASGASDWSASPDWRVFTFHLRPEVRFSDGRRVTSADYAYGLERIANPKTASMNLDYLIGIRGAAEMKAGKTNRLSGITIRDDNTLIIELETNDVTFPYAIAG